MVVRAAVAPVAAVRVVVARPMSCPTEVALLAETIVLVQVVAAVVIKVAVEVVQAALLLVRRK